MARALIRLGYAGDPRIRRSLDWLAKEFFRPMHQKFADMVREGIASGEFRSIDPDQTALMTLQMTVSYFAAAPILSHVVGRDLLAAEAVAARKRALLDFLNHAITRNGARG